MLNTYLFLSLGRPNREASTAAYDYGSLEARGMN